MFKLRVVHEHATDPETKRHLGRIEEALKIIIHRLNKMALDFTRLETEIAENTSAVQSAVTLIEAIAQAIRDEAGNRTKIIALADQLSAVTDGLAAAVAANTPAAEPTT